MQMSDILESLNLDVTTDTDSNGPSHDSCFKRTVGPKKCTLTYGGPEAGVVLLQLSLHLYTYLTRKLLLLRFTRLSQCHAISHRKTSTNIMK